MMSDTEMEWSPTKSAHSHGSRSSNSSRTATPNQIEPVSDCERRRQAMIRLRRQDVLIEGYQKFLIHERNSKDETGICKDLKQNLRETKQARAKLVSELRTIPCLDNNCPGHSTLGLKTNELLNDTEMIKSNNNDKKKPRREKIAKITRMTLSFQVKPLAQPPQLQYFNQLKPRILSLT
ncbi:uncharacterized protein TNIN_133841 [Trichonephila inaurata madagascariensis]|uniref:Uncharacterized protein n=1 Tax=Trichonephila inaurata madagascariensis TaxID=2747483 RepID=A0A8X7BRB9_9ARAC|nr:uncharacterized protein TNIN_133841 [Trichonephila inaurata madagascariensis]